MKDVTIPQPEHRIVDVEKTVHFSNEKATLTEIIVTPHSSIVVWGVKPGQTVAAHTHPDGQDTWVMVRPRDAAV